MSNSIPLINKNSLGLKIAEDEASLKRFWRWFGNSATVDHQGRPVVFYHGSPYKFERFKTKNVFFSTKRSFALDYAVDKSFQEGLDASPKIYDCYLRLKKPLDIGKPKKISSILNKIGGEKITVYGNLITKTDLKNILEGKEPYRYISNFDETSVGDFICEYNTTSMKYPVGRDDYIVAYKTPTKVYGVRVLDMPLERYGARDSGPYVEDPYHDVAMYSRTVKTVDGTPNNKTLELIISQEEAYQVMEKVRSANIVKAIREYVDFEKSDYGDDGVFTEELSIPFVAKTYERGKVSQPKQMEAVVRIEVAEYTDKETARLIKSQSNWFTLESLEIGDQSFFDFLRGLGFDACYMFENGVLNVCMFNRYDIKSVDNSGKFREKGKITESVESGALINQNHNGEEIADNEESLKNFWKWFGKSATVDRDGRPVVFYHGSSYVFNEFTAFPIIGQMADDKAVFFSTNEEFANGFAQDRMERIREREMKVDEDLITAGALNDPNPKVQKFEIDERLYSCYVRVKNPFNPKNTKHINAVMNWITSNVPEWKHQNFNFDLIKSKLSGSYLHGYIDDYSTLRLWDVVAIPPVAKTSPVDILQKGDALTMPKALSGVSYNTAQIFLKGKKTALAYSIEINRKSAADETIKFPHNYDTKYEFTVSPQQIVELIRKSGLKFNDAAKKKINAQLPIKVTTKDEQEPRYETVPCHIIVWSITSKENARSTTNKTTWEEVENLIVDGQFSFVGILKKLGFDSFYTFEDGKLNIAVFDPKNIKSVANNGKWSEQGNIYESRQ